MQFRALAALALATAAVATPTRRGSCSSGSLQCCNSLTSSGTPGGTNTASTSGLLGIVLQGVDVLVGHDCSPINVIGVGAGNACNANVVCCQDNSNGGLISIGCVPVIL